MTEVNKFKALETLGFALSLKNYTEFQTFEKCFKGLEYLTHLSIDLLNRSHFNPLNKKDLLKHIDKSLPKLRVLRFRSDSIEISEQTVNSLGRLSRLESIDFYINNKSIRDSIVDKIKRNCRKIKSIKIYVNY